MYVSFLSFLVGICPHQGLYCSIHVSIGLRAAYGGLSVVLVGLPTPTNTTEGKRAA